MPKLTGERPVIRISTFVYEEDWAKLDLFVTPELNKSALVRRIIHTFVTHGEARMRAAVDRTADRPTEVTPDA
jgi:hypothetical protein